LAKVGFVVITGVPDVSVSRPCGDTTTPVTVPGAPVAPVSPFAPCALTTWPLKNVVGG